MRAFFLQYKWVHIIAVFCLFLLGLRIYLTGSLFFIFLPWNLFLAYLPLIASYYLLKMPGKDRQILRTLILLSWLAFLPNSFYIVTDLVHLTGYRLAPKWFDLLMIFSFAWTGILCGIISLVNVERSLDNLVSRKSSAIILFTSICLTGFGIYIGRYLRFNSWDIVSNPGELVNEISLLFLFPFDNLRAWSMSLTYGAFIFLAYQSVKNLHRIITSLTGIKN